MTTTIEKLKVGQRFSWLPREWFGVCRLTYKSRRERMPDCDGYVYDLKYDAKVVNPPGVSYGVPANTRVRLLAPLSKLKRQPKDGI